MEGAIKEMCIPEGQDAITIISYIESKGFKTYSYIDAGVDVIVEITE